MGSSSESFVMTCLHDTVCRIQFLLWPQIKYICALAYGNERWCQIFTRSLMAKFEI